MNGNKDANAQDFRIMKQVDMQYGERMKSGKTAPKKEKTKHRQDFSRMSVHDILEMELEDYQD